MKKKKYRSDNEEKGFRIVFCGKGRIGSKVIESLKELEIGIEFAILECNQGLVGVDLETPIDLLVICISSTNKSWSWENVFNGLSSQVQNNKKLFKYLIFVSSTRVYDGIKTGFIDCNTNPIAESKKARQLLQAEFAVSQIALTYRLVRPVGIYGSNYTKYISILNSATDKPRFGVTENTIRECIVDLVMRAREEKLSTGVDLLTDRITYFKGERLNFDQQERLKYLSHNYRLFVNSSN